MKTELKRLTELADRSYNSGQFTFTDFLSVAELAVYYENEAAFRFACPKLFGGKRQTMRPSLKKSLKAFEAFCNRQVFRATMALANRALFSRYFHFHHTALAAL